MFVDLVKRKFFYNCTILYPHRVYGKVDPIVLVPLGLVDHLHPLVGGEAFLQDELAAQHISWLDKRVYIAKSVLLLALFH